MGCKGREGRRRWWCGLFGALGLMAAMVEPASAQQQEITGKDGVPMVLVPAGEFTMGNLEGDDDEASIHRVYLEAFYMNKFEVMVG